MLVPNDLPMIPVPFRNENEGVLHTGALKCTVSFERVVESWGRSFGRSFFRNYKYTVNGGKRTQPELLHVNPLCYSTTVLGRHSRRNPALKNLELLGNFLFL